MKASAQNPTALPLASDAAPPAPKAQAVPEVQAVPALPFSAQLVSEPWKQVSASALFLSYPQVFPLPAVLYLSLSYLPKVYL